MLIDALAQLPPGSAETADLLATIDACLLTGFSSAPPYSMLGALQRSFQGTPLAERVKRSAEALGQSIFQPEHFVALAAARSALAGAVYDALRAHALGTLGRTDTTAAPTTLMSPTTTPLLESAQHWLMELAISGFSRLSAESLLAIQPTLAELRAQPQQISAATLLSGFVNELKLALPQLNTSPIPLQRWCDLWATTMLHCVGWADSTEATVVDGTLFPLAIEIREHATMVSLLGFGLLEQSDRRDVVRLTWSRYKSSSILGSEAWLLERDAAPWISALTQGNAFMVKQAKLLPSGDLLWDTDTISPGPSYKLAELVIRHFVPNAAEPLSAPAVPPLARHPIQLAEPLVLRGCTLTETHVSTAEGETLALRIPNSASNFGDLPLACDWLFGLLSFDAGAWCIHPLVAAKPKGKPNFPVAPIAKLIQKPPKNSSIVVLEERASRLLRK